MYLFSCVLSYENIDVKSDNNISNREPITPAAIKNIIAPNSDTINANIAAGTAKNIYAKIVKNVTM